MGFIRRQADLVAAIAASEKLSARQKHHAYEEVVTQNHHEAAREIWEELLLAGPLRAGFACLAAHLIIHEPPSPRTTALSVRLTAVAC